eukprot:898004-Rhodomonas_salina.1
MLLPVWYAVSGTDLAYSASRPTRCPVLTLAMLLPDTTARTAPGLPMAGIAPTPLLRDVRY